MKNIKGSFILFVAAFFWGTTFVAQVSGSNHIGAFSYNASRSFVGCLFLFAFALIRDYIKVKKQPDARKERWPIKGGIVCGIVLFAAMSTQQCGIAIYPENVAAAGRSGFLTAIYVVIVAVVASILQKHINKLVLLSVVVSVFGMYLLCMKEGFSGIYTGDVLSLICAFCFAGHILVVDQNRKIDSVKLSCIQFFVAGILACIVSLCVENVVWSDIMSAAIPILYAGVFSSGVAYTLQMVGQKYAEPAVASIVMSLESVIAVIAGAVVLGEKLAGREIFGCVLVFAAVIVAQIPAFLKRGE